MLNHTIANIGLKSPEGKCKCAITYIDGRDEDGLGYEEWLVQSYSTRVINVVCDHDLTIDGYPTEAISITINRDYLIAGSPYRTVSTTRHITRALDIIFGITDVRDKFTITKLRDYADLGELMVVPVFEDGQLTYEHYCEVFTELYL